MAPLLALLKPFANGEIRMDDQDRNGGSLSFSLQVSADFPSQKPRPRHGLSVEVHSDCPSAPQEETRVTPCSAMVCEDV